MSTTQNPNNDIPLENKLLNFIQEELLKGNKEFYKVLPSFIEENIKEFSENEDLLNRVNDFITENAILDLAKIPFDKKAADLKAKIARSEPDTLVEQDKKDLDIIEGKIMSIERDQADKMIELIENLAEKSVSPGMEKNENIIVFSVGALKEYIQAYRTTNDKKLGEEFLDIVNLALGYSVKEIDPKVPGGQKGHINDFEKRALAEIFRNIDAKVTVDSDNNVSITRSNGTSVLADGLSIIYDPEDKKVNQAPIVPKDPNKGNVRE
jgi:hypothetical protein